MQELLQQFPEELPLVVGQPVQVTGRRGDHDALQGRVRPDGVDEFDLLIGVEGQRQPPRVLVYFFPAGVAHLQFHVSRSVQCHGDQRLLEAAGIHRRAVGGCRFHQYGVIIDV